jgi:short-subunit dehydrogenase
MASPTYTSALIVGAGQGLSASLTRSLRKDDIAVAIAARDNLNGVRRTVRHY